MRYLTVLILLHLLMFPVLCSGEDIREAGLNRGIKNNEPYSYLLIRKAGENREESVHFLREAMNASPDLPAVYFSTARSRVSPSYTGLFETVNYTIEGIFAYARNFWWSFTLSGSLLFSLVLSFITAVTIVLITRLPADIRLFAHDAAETKHLLLILVLVIALSVISPLLLLAGMLVISGIYMKKSSRILVYFFLVAIILSPLFFRAASVYLNALSSARLKSVVEVNEAKGSRYAIAVLANSKDYPEVFSHALAMKREGMYAEAAAAYRSLVQDRPDPKAYVNLGNSYVGLKDLDSAKAYYLKSIEIEPLPSAYYNLSQLSRELLDFPGGHDYFNKALELNREAVADYRAVSSRHPNRIVADETLGFSALWRFALADSGSVSTLGASVLPAPVLSGAAFLLLFLYIFLDFNFKDKAYRCKRCSTILCSRCEHRITWGKMCHPCYASLIKLDQLEVKERVARLLSIHHHQKKRRTVMKLLTFILPGLSQIYAGKVLLGFALLWPFLFFLFLPFTNAGCAGGGVLFAHSFFSGAALFLAALIYLIANILTRQRIARGWL
jgi:tetratricopeptide (TPR) repeat protein